MGKRGPKPRPIEDRLWERVNKNGPVMPGMTTPCWVWMGSVDRKGYGKIGRSAHGSGWEKAHAVAWKSVNGPLPEGKPCILHRCDNPPCCRAEPGGEGHLFPGTVQENLADMRAKGRSFPQKEPERAREHLSKIRALVRPRPPAPPKPCTNCGVPAKPLRRGLCHACNEYQRRHGVPRPTREAS